MKAMAKRKRKSVNHFSLVLAAGTVRLNGKEFQGRSLDYERWDFDDGTVQERGLPAGMSPRPTIQQLSDWVFGRTPPGKE